MDRSVEHAGCRLAYEVEGAGPPIVFIQGVGVHGRGWTPQVEGLRGEFACLSFDNRGMGRSVPVGVKVSVEQMAQDTARIMDDAGWESAHLVAHSLGGLVAIQLALRSRERVRSLALLCTVARGRDATRVSARMLWIGIRSRVGPRVARRGAFLELVMPPAPRSRAETAALAARLQPLFGHDLAVMPPIAMRQLRAMRACDATRRLPELKGVPTLVVSAEHDPIAPPGYGRQLAAGIPGARYVEFAGAAHGLPIHLPGEVNLLLREHLRAAEAATARAAPA